MTIYGVNPPGYGFAPEQRDGIAICRNGNVSAGRVYVFCMNQSAQITNDSVTLSTTPGEDGFPYANITTLSSTDRRAGRFCVALEDGVDGRPVKVRVKGIVRVRVVDSANTAITIGKELTSGSGSNANNLDAAQTNFTGSTTLRKILGYALEAYSSTPSDGTTMLVDFDGWDGVGSGNAS